MFTVILKLDKTHLKPMSWYLLALICLSACSPSDTGSEAEIVSNDTYDLVINNGRVIDPETQLDEIRSIGIKRGEIIEISLTALEGTRIIDANGLVVSPGFIDLHAHGQSKESNRFQVHDGVTTALELELGTPVLERWLNSKKGGGIINYGASVSHLYARTAASSSFVNRTSPNEALEPEQIIEMGEIIDEELNAGGIGIGLAIGYVPGASSEEIYQVFEKGAEESVPVFVHLRNPDISSIEEVIDYARMTGSSLHIMHINSMALGEIDLALDLIEQAKNSGLDITTEMYPYTAGSTFIETAIFDDGWQERFNISYEDLQWQDTGERLTEQSFNEYRQLGGAVILHMMREEWLEKSLVDENTLIASDGMQYAPGAHPRSAGTFSRVLGKYVREQNILTLNEALRKMTLMPAQRLESIVPLAAKKGRIQVGMDADITIFNPKTILDQATFEEGLKYSIGVEFVIVNGVLVVDGGETVENVFPGEPLLGLYLE
ncbi:amidohydrolase family protein [Gammaproteobacteria bacterium]|nr:amidohydrolase family protein [Gammaproteobacteria bacterium]